MAGARCEILPLVGALIGAVARRRRCWRSAMIFPEPLPIVVGLATAIVLTGALHEDGLADTADAFGGGQDRERCLEIMKDSRIGTFGTLALDRCAGPQGCGAAPLDPLAAARVLIAGHAGARLATVLTLSGLSYAGDGKAKVSRTHSI